jgi:hypothetical protein
MLKAFAFGELLTGFGVLTLVVLGLIILTDRLSKRFFERSGTGPEGQEPPPKEGTAAPQGQEPPSKAGTAVPQGQEAPEKTNFFGRATKTVGQVMQAIGVAGFVLWAFDATGLWRPVWSICGLNQLVFPDLNGTWTGTILSNGRIHKHPDACTKPLPSPDRTNCVSPDPEKFVCLPVEVTISMTLLSTDVELILCDDLKSESTGESLTRRAGLQDPRLSYQFESKNPGASSPEAFHGAGYIDIEINKPIPLRGTYWTNRDWRLGHQTAGEVRLVRK